MALADTAPDSTRDRLLHAAVEVFSERGYDGAGVQEIARRAGLTTGAIYGNFRGKADLLLRAIGLSSGDELDALVAGWGGVPAGELLAALGSGLLAEREEGRPSLLVETFARAGRDPDVAAVLRARLDERAERIAAIIERGRAEGAVAADVSTEAFVTFGLVLLLGAVVFKAIAVERPPESEWAALIHRIVAALGGGPCQPPTSQGESS